MFAIWYMDSVVVFGMIVFFGPQCRGPFGLGLEASSTPPVLSPHITWKLVQFPVLCLSIVIPTKIMKFGITTYQTTYLYVLWSIVPTGFMKIILENIFFGTFVCLVETCLVIFANF